MKTPNVRTAFPFLLFLLIVLPVQASIRNFFVQLNSAVLDLLPKETRLDMMDYAEAGRSKIFLNTLEGTATVLEYAPGYLKLTPSPVSTVTIKELPQKADTVYMVLYTIGSDGQAPDTTIDFYTSAAKPIPRKKFWKDPEVADFLELPSLKKDDRQQIIRLIPFPTFEFSANPENNELCGHLTVGEFMPQEDYKRIVPYLRENVTFYWNGKNYKITNRQSK